MQSESFDSFSLGWKASIALAPILFLWRTISAFFGFPSSSEKAEEAAHAHPVAAPIIPDPNAARCLLSGDDRDAADAALIAAGIKRPSSRSS